ncbi:MAG: DUF928 domain-containing protein [Synechococcales bacterium]|nr:DUF928 domain-containing protein [Synechococcales bacterium]
MALAVGTSHLLPSAAQDQPIAQPTRQRPPDPPTNPPPNQTRPGGGLNPETSAMCSPQNLSLRALVPVESPVLTASDYPTFFFYVPFGKEVVERVEFSILRWPGERERHYKAVLSLPEEPGILSVSLPPNPDYALEAGQHYRWYFHVYCQDGMPQQPDLTVNGVIQRVVPTPERDRQIQSGSPAIWHDALARVAEQLQASPGDEEILERWRSLLQQIDASDLAYMPLFGPVVALE